MRRKLPPLNAVRAFEAAARHESFRLAAEELCVTHSAISHQVKTLENYLQIELFHRRARSVKLTDAGNIYLPILRNSLDQIAEASKLVRSAVSGSKLTIQVYTSFAVRWLISRLPDFQRTHPDIQVDLRTSTFDVNFAREDIDISVGVLLEEPKLPNIEHVKLFESEMFPVCSPKLLSGDKPLKSLDQLQNHTLLKVESWQQDWPEWLKDAGISGLEPRAIIEFDSYALSLDSAIDGVGISMTRTPFGARDLAAGRLIAPFEVRSKAQGAWYLLWRIDRFKAEKIQLFNNWLIDQVKQDPFIEDLSDD